MIQILTRFGGWAATAIAAPLLIVFLTEAFKSPHLVENIEVITRASPINLQPIQKDLLRYLSKESPGKIDEYIKSDAYQTLRSDAIFINYDISNNSTSDIVDVSVKMSKFYMLNIGSEIEYIDYNREVEKKFRIPPQKTVSISGLSSGSLSQFDLGYHSSANITVAVGDKVSHPKSPKIIPRSEGPLDFYWRKFPKTAAIMLIIGFIMTIVLFSVSIQYLSEYAAYVIAANNQKKRPSE
jgi:hypothetical protein